MENEGQGMRRILTSAAVLAAMTSGAMAADLGGNCCADLEERVAELEATTAKKGNRKMTLSIYGQVNKALIWHDLPGLNGSEKFRVIDNANSGSRLGFTGKAQVNKDVSFGFLIELGVDETKGGLLYGAGAVDDIGLRHSAVWVETTMGKLTLGQTSSATDGVVEIDLSNSNVASLPMSVEPLWTWAGAPSIGGLSLNPTPFDGSRIQVVRYDTPTIGGFSAAAAWGGGTTATAQDVWDVALRYAGEFGGFRVAVGAGYRVEDFALMTGGESTAMLASGSAMHLLSGIFVTGAAGMINDHWGVDGLDLQMWHARAGVEKKFLEFGASTLFAEYASHKIEFGSASIDSSFIGIGAVQAIDAAAADLYVSFRRYDLGGELDANVFMGGMRVKF